jgi:hypothetical protein
MPVAAPVSASAPASAAGDQLLEQRDHLVGALVEPGLDLGGAVHQRPPTLEPVISGVAGAAAAARRVSRPASGSAGLVQAALVAVEADWPYQAF